MSATALAALPLARASEPLQSVVVRVDALALVALLAAVVHRWARLVPVSLLALGGVYAAQLVVDDAPLDSAAPVVAAGLYLTAELAYWSLEEREDVVSEPGEGLRRVAFLAGLVLGALIVTAALLAVVDTVRARGLTVDLVGAAGAAGVLVAIVLLARGPGRPER